jgi:hypothetical protein
MQGAFAQRLKESNPAVRALRPGTVIGWPEFRSMVTTRSNTNDRKPWRINQAVSGDEGLRRV